MEDPLVGMGGGPATAFTAFDAFEGFVWATEPQSQTFGERHVSPSTRIAVKGELDRLTSEFFRAVSFEAGEVPPCQGIHQLFIQSGLLIKTPHPYRGSRRLASSSSHVRRW